MLTVGLHLLHVAQPHGLQEPNQARLITPQNAGAGRGLTVLTGLSALVLRLGKLRLKGLRVPQLPWIGLSIPGWGSAFVLSRSLPLAPSAPSWSQPASPPVCSSVGHGVVYRRRGIIELSGNSFVLWL